MKKYIPGLASLLFLGASYLLIRTSPFPLHGMKNFPVMLLLTGSMIIILGICLGQKAVPVFTGVGYPIGFMPGYLFQTNGSNGTNSLWIIWMCSYAAIIILGVALAVCPVSARFLPECITHT